MARTDVETLVVQMSADLKQFERAFARASGVSIREMRKIERQAQVSVTRIENVFSRFGRGLLAGAGITGIASLGKVISDAISGAASIGDLSDKLGTTTEQLQGLQFGAVQANMDFEELSGSLLKFSKALGEAANGQGELRKQLQANGKELKGSFFENLLQFADLVKNASNEQDQLLLITQAFGRGGAPMLEFLKGGSDGLLRFMGAAKDAGAVLDDELIKKAQVIDDRWAALMLSMSSRFKNMVLQNISTFQSLVDALSDPNAKSALTQIMENLGFTGLAASALPQRPSGALPRTSTGSGILSPQEPPTKIFDPEADAEKRKRLAEALREEKRAREELTREIERGFEAFTRSLSQTDEQIAFMELEAATLGQSTSEIERQRIALELLNEARQNGIPITDDLNAVIQQSAAAYGDAAQKLEDLQKQQEINEEITSQVKDSFKGFITDIASGVEPVEALTNALGRLADRLLDLALDNVLNSLLQPSGTAGGGGLGGLLANVLHGGGVVGSGGGRRAVSPMAFVGARRMHSGGIAGDEVAAILQKGEIVLPKGTRAGGGGSVEINVSNPPGTRTERRERREGGRTIIDIVNSAVDTRLASQSTDKLFAAKFGMRPVVKRH